MHPIVENTALLIAPTRRRILKGLAAGAGVAVWHGSLPSKWVTPIIEGITLPAHAQTSDPASRTGDPVPVCTDLVMSQVDGTSYNSSLIVSASGKFPAEYAGQVFSISFEAYKEVVVTQAEGKNRGVLAAAAEMFSAPTAHAAAPACVETVQVTAGTDGGFTARVTLTCGPGYKQVLAVVRTGASGGSECCRGVLDIAGCNPCSTPAKTCVQASVLVRPNQNDSVQWRLDGVDQPQADTTVTLTPTTTISFQQTGGSWFYQFYKGGAVLFNGTINPDPTNGWHDIPANMIAKAVAACTDELLLS